DQDEPGDREAAADREGGEIAGTGEAFLLQFGAQEGERVALYGQPQGRVILDDMLAQGHFREERGGMPIGVPYSVIPGPERSKGARNPRTPAIGVNCAVRATSLVVRVLGFRARRFAAPRNDSGVCSKQRQRGGAERFQCPEAAASVEAAMGLIERAQRIGGGEAFQRGAAEP